MNTKLYYFLPLSIVILVAFFIATMPITSKVGAVSGDVKPASELHKQYLMDYSEEFLTAFEENDVIDSIIARNTTKVGDLLLLAPERVCVCLDVTQKDNASWGYHVDMHELKNCSLFMNVPPNEYALVIKMEKIAEGCFVEKVGVITKDGIDYDISLKLVYTVDM